MESMSLTLGVTLLCLVFALFFLFMGLRVFRNFKNLSKILNRAHEMTGESVGSYTVYYVPSDPACCVVEEFRKPMQRSRTGSLVGAVILFFFTFNLVVSSLSTLFLG